MSEVIGKWLVIALVICFMFAPLLAYNESLQREAVEVTLDEAAKQASIQGEFTPQIIQGMKDTLANDYHFDPNKITINATTSLTPRNQYIDGEIIVPRGILFVLDFFDQGPRTIDKKIQVMSEYIGN